MSRFDHVFLPLPIKGSGPAYLFGTHAPWAALDIFDSETNIHAPNESMRLHDFRYMTAFIIATAIELWNLTQPHMYTNTSRVSEKKESKHSGNANSAI